MAMKHVLFAKLHVFPSASNSTDIPPLSLLYTELISREAFLFCKDTRMLSVESSLSICTGKLVLAIPSAFNLKCRIRRLVHGNVGS